MRELTHEEKVVMAILADALLRLPSNESRETVLQSFLRTEEGD